MLTFEQAKADQVAYIATLDPVAHRNSVVAAKDFQEYLLQHDEDTYWYLLEALFAEDEIICHSPSDAQWHVTGIAPTILRAAGINYEVA